MRSVMTLGGAALVLAGLVWVGQGLNLPFAPRSFMSADRAWVLVGAVTAVAGAILIGCGRRSA